ncbi:MAG: ribonuclease H-like domain-containing protein [Treponema sp.]|nr:ribonuclease H-like domain-containing protein [Treponema sp.]
MGHSLRDRLQAIKSLKMEAGLKKAVSKDALSSANAADAGAASIGAASADAIPPGWLSVAGLVKKRVLTLDMPAPVPDLTKTVRQSLAILTPDLLHAFHADYAYEDFVFFDLETTGLSSGAGTLAFIAAFGRLKKARRGYALQCAQYLLLDYPGENDFLEAALGALRGEFDAPFIVTYNGKCFDSQILKTRCLMNAIAPPVFRHVDLLHPARRLWKRTLSSCSQSEIETAVLGLDRTGDISGAFAPDIWFSFLRTGEWEPLLGMCDHNKRDIFGLASIFIAFTHIAAAPAQYIERYGVDRERLALRWRSVLKRGGADVEETVRGTGGDLIRDASERGCPKAALVLAFDRMRAGAFEEGRQRLLAAAVAADFPDAVKARALRGLAIDAERRLKDRGKALAYVEQGLALSGVGSVARVDFERRKERLLKKLKLGAR